ncbi:spore coat protein [Oceanobacillus zhaokaii]|uniref:Spore coat protein n=1 Tax=Oceanobacillus zhaokaii TaxID=2052660 RepID=A0A345PJB5_9BACI|nr:CotY/CotZ family spore coat protein [Oceanobacillus zhaokaii]AXI10095.1 spore coat protein [Oceanobacillus zhaokaii]
MGCEKERNSVCKAVENIKNLQDAVDEQCSTSCFHNLLAPTQFVGDTIPFILFDKNSDLFKAFGNVGGLLGGECFRTPFFKVQDISKDGCATLSLLKPFKNGNPINFGDVDNICDVNILVKTDFCIEVDLRCFCAIQCLDPLLIHNNFALTVTESNDTTEESNK